jgi:hypothetical protein
MGYSEVMTSSIIDPLKNSLQEKGKARAEAIEFPMQIG